MKGNAPGWQVRCPRCNFKIEAGHAGIIRIGAVGTTRRLGTCSRCSRWRWLVVESRTDPGVKINPNEGYAPGWTLRCSVCGKSTDAAKVGFIANDKDAGGEITGPCSGCGKKKQRLVLERTGPAEADPASSFPANSASSR